jgi:branched-chain amino acid transport system ATP-binding protein
MLRIANLDVSIGPVVIIRGASLRLEAGEMCGLIGRNGAGKTRLMRALMGALPASGTAELAGADLLRLPAHHRVAHGIGYMPEDRRLVPEFTGPSNHSRIWLEQIELLVFGALSGQFRNAPSTC